MKKLDSEKQKRADKVFNEFIIEKMNPLPGSPEYEEKIKKLYKAADNLHNQNNGCLGVLLIGLLLAIFLN